MLRISCPWCGARDETEFSFGGEAHLRHPVAPERLTDEEWARFVFVRANPTGASDERWYHAAGCRRWFKLRRDRTTNAVLAAWPLEARGAQADAA